MAFVICYGQRDVQMCQYSAEHKYTDNKSGRLTVNVWCDDSVLVGEAHCFQFKPCVMQIFFNLEL